MNRINRRIISVFLCAILLLTTIPVNDLYAAKKSGEAEKVDGFQAANIEEHLGDRILTEEDFRNDALTYDADSWGVGSLGLTETTADTGMLGTQLTGLAAKAYKGFEQLKPTADSNGMTFSYDYQSSSDPARTSDGAWQQLCLGMYAYFYDHPEEFFWCQNAVASRGIYTGSAYLSCTVYYVVSPYYEASLEETAKQKLTSAVAAVDSSQSLEEQLRQLHDWVIDIMEYDYEALSTTSEERRYYAHTALGGLLNGLGVCESYAKTYAMLCDRMGFTNVYAVSSSHAYNYVKMDDSLWYMVDCTWDDGSYNSPYFLASNNPYQDESHTDIEDYDYPKTSYSRYTSSQGHQYDAGLLMKRASCTEDGMIIYTCLDCGQTMTKTIPRTGHRYVIVETTATCEQAGYTVHCCEVCEDTYQAAVDALGHDFSKYDIKWAEDYRTASLYLICANDTTHTKLAQTVETTAEDGAAYPDCTNYGNGPLTATFQIADAETGMIKTITQTATGTFLALGHDYGSETVVTEPTCIGAGAAVQTCSRCGDKQTTSIPALGHDYVVTETEATCTTAGAAVETCSRCGDKQTTSIPALGHDYVTSITAATCEKDGKEVQTCSRCKDKKTSTIPAIGHTPGDPVVENEVAATYTSKGSYDLVVYCTVCKKELQRDPCETPMLERDDPEEEEITYTRYAGANRYETAIESAEALKDILGVDSFDAVVIASGTNFPDALAGSPLATQNNAPILLVESVDRNGQTARGTAATLEYISENLNAGGTVYILGGKSAVTELTEQLLLEAGYRIKRLYGANRYETNLAIVNEMSVAKGSDIVIVRGCTSYKNADDAAAKRNPQGYADSLSVSAAAGAQGMPIILADKNGLTKEQLQLIEDIEPEHIYIIGGESAVSAAVYQELANDQGEEKLTRIAGANRYATSVAIAETFGLADAETVVLAYGQNYPDGLTGGVLAAKSGAPLLLVENGRVEEQKKLIRENNVTKLLVLGGESVMPDSMIQYIVNK